MNIVLSGGTGFIGKALIDHLRSKGHQISVLSRSDHPAVPAGIDVYRWDGKSMDGSWSGIMNRADAVVNLAGESLANKRWTPSQKEKLVASRIEPTRALVEAMHRSGHKPSILVNASGVGFYGDTGEMEITESNESGNDFLARLCRMWEEEACKAESLGVRVVRMRLGVVLDREKGGALPKMVTPFRLFVGGPLGSGQQWFPWIHRDDVVGIVEYILGHPNISGAVDAVAPDRVRMKQFSCELGRALHRPSWAPVPAFALRILLGEMAEMLLSGQNAEPAALVKAGYQFLFPTLRQAFENIFQGNT